MEYIKFSSFIKSIQYGYTADETSNSFGDAKYLRITDIVPYFIDIERVPFCSIDSQKIKKYLVKENDLLIARTGATTGYNLVVPKGFENYIFASYLVRISYDQSSLYPRYLMHVLKSKQWYGFINNYIGGSAQPGMNPKTFGRFQIPFVDFSAQKKISKLLDYFDSLIENNVKRIHLLEGIAQEFYREWFVRLRPPLKLSGNYVLQSPKGWILSSGKMIKIPSEWRLGPLKSIGVFKRGRNIISSQMIEGSVPVVSAGIEPSGCHNQANVYGESLTISSSGANAGYLSYHLCDIWAADCSYCQSEYIWFIYNSLRFLQPVIDNLQIGAAQPHVYSKDVNDISIIIPNKKLISLYCDKVRPIYSQIKTLNKENGILENMRDILLPRLVNGKLDISKKEIA